MDQTCSANGQRESETATHNHEISTMCEIKPRTTLTCHEA